MSVSVASSKLLDNVIGTMIVSPTLTQMLVKEEMMVGVGMDEKNRLVVKEVLL
jgi:hypothetical protein